MIINIKNLIGNLYNNEDYYTDKDARALAEKAFSFVKNDLGSFSVDNWQTGRLDYEGSTLSGVMREIPDGIGSKVGLFICIPSRYTNTGGFFSKKSNIIVIIVNSLKLSYSHFGNTELFEYPTDTVIKDNFLDRLQYVFQSDSDVRTHFIHEFTHYLDSKRFDFDKATRGYTNKDKKKYLANPLEFNAFYQGYLSFLEDNLKAFPLQQQLEIFSNYYNFRGWVRSYTYGNVYDLYKDSELEKKLERRLYKFFDNKGSELKDFEKNIFNNFKQDISDLFKTLNRGLIKYKLDREESDRNSVDSLVMLITDKLPIYKYYLDKYSESEKTYNEEFINYLVEYFTENYPEFKDQVLTDLDNFKWLRN